MVRVTTHCVAVVRSSTHIRHVAVACRITRTHILVRVTTHCVAVVRSSTRIRHVTVACRITHVAWSGHVIWWIDTCVAVVHRATLCVSIHMVVAITICLVIIHIGSVPIGNRWSIGLPIFKIWVKVASLITIFFKLPFAATRCWYVTIFMA